MRYSPSTKNFYPEEIRYRSLPDDLIEVSEDDYRKVMARPVGSTFEFRPNGSLFIRQSTSVELSDEQVAVLNLQSQARSLLEKSDVAVLRCFEAGIPLPEAWLSYRRQLRAVASGTQDTLPGQPPYPEGT